MDGRQPITQADLKKAKDFMAGKFILDLEDSENVAQYYGMKQLLIGEIESPDEVLAKYQAVTLEDMNRVAKDIIQMNQIRFAIIGPFEDPQKFQQLLPSTSTTKAEEK